QKPHQTAKESGKGARLFRGKFQDFMEIARQRSERRVIGKSLEQLADVGDPERALEAHANVAPTLRKAQNVLLDGNLAPGGLQPLFDLCGGDPVHTNDFVPAAFPGGYRNRRTRHIQNFGQKFNASLVGAAFHWRRSQGQLQCVADFTPDGVLLCPGMNLHLKGCAGWRIADGNHGFGRSPKIAVPMRTQVDPSSMATSKSCDIPIESWSRLTAGKLRVAKRSRNSWS